MTDFTLAVKRLESWAVEKTMMMTRPKSLCQVLEEEAVPATVEPISVTLTLLFLALEAAVHLEQGDTMEVVAAVDEVCTAEEQAMKADRIKVLPGRRTLAGRGKLVESTPAGVTTMAEVEVEPNTEEGTGSNSIVSSRKICFDSNGRSVVSAGQEMLHSTSEACTDPDLLCSVHVTTELLRADACVGSLLSYRELFRFILFRRVDLYNVSCNCSSVIGRCERRRPE